MLSFQTSCMSFSERRYLAESSTVNFFQVDDIQSLKLIWHKGPAKRISFCLQIDCDGESLGASVSLACLYQRPLPCVIFGSDLIFTRQLGGFRHGDVYNRTFCRGLLLGASHENLNEAYRLHWQHSPFSGILGKHLLSSTTVPSDTLSTFGCNGSNKDCGDNFDSDDYYISCLFDLHSMSF